MLYEEMQDLSEEMVIHHLNQNGWSNFPDMKRHILKPWDIVIDFSDMEDAIRVLAQLGKVSPQVLLRKLNPRLRSGLPSKAAWAAHGGEKGRWVAVWNATMEQTDAQWRHLIGRPIITEIHQDNDQWRWGIPGVLWSECPGHPGGREWGFWPCDYATGTKVPWPEKDGVLL